MIPPPWGCCAQDATWHVLPLFVLCCVRSHPFSPFLLPGGLADRRHGYELHPLPRDLHHRVRHPAQAGRRLARLWVPAVPLMIVAALYVRVVVAGAVDGVVPFSSAAVVAVRGVLFRGLLSIRSTCLLQSSAV